MDESRLDERHEWIGNWWLPEEPSVRAPGVLTYEPGQGLSLKLIGGWEYRTSTDIAPGLTARHDEYESWPVIHGLSDALQITLMETHVAHVRGPLGGPPYELEVAAETALIGTHIVENDQSVFVSCTVTVENLTGWSTWGRAVNRARGASRDSSAETVTAILGDVTVSLHTWPSRSSMEIRRDGRSEKSHDYVSVEFECCTPKTVDGWLEMVASVHDLISLSTLTACADISLTLTLSPMTDQDPGEDPLAQMKRPVQVLQQHIVQPDPSGKAAVNFLLSEADMPFAQLMPSWMQVRERFAAARSMILGLRYVSAGYLETRVATAVGAAEAFHRALNPPSPIPAEEFAELRRGLLAVVPPGRRQWLNDRINHNEPSLKQRLLDLSERPGPFMTTLLPSPESWARAAVRARNDLAHRGTSEHHYEYLHAVVEVTSAVVVINLLKEVGVSEDRLETALEEHAALRWARVLAGRYFGGTLGTKTAVPEPAA